MKISKTKLGNQKVTESGIVAFINNIATNNFKQADAALAAVVNEKIKHRILSADRKLANTKK